MEFFLPSLAALLLVSLLIFFVFPRFGAPILVILSLLLLSYGLFNHIKLFSSEYRLSTWQEQLKLYAPFIMIAVVLLTIISYLGFLFASKGPEALPTPNLPEPAPLPPANTATNIVTETINNGLRGANKVNNVLNTGLNTVTNTISNAVNEVKNIANIQSLLGSPVKNRANMKVNNSEL